MFAEDDFPNIETTAYVLLAHLSMMEVPTYDINYASQLVVNLNKQRNIYGGFSSTQVTLILIVPICGDDSRKTSWGSRSFAEDLI